MKRTLAFALFFVFAYTLPVAAQVPVDTVMFQRDSAIVPETDPTVLFFQQGEKVANPAKTFLTQRNGKRVTLAALLKSQDFDPYGDHALADLDQDGKKELLLNNYTGGAHCCDEIYIYRNTAANRYQFAGKLFAGHTVITENMEFIYSFYEQYGYFFTCYACGLEDTTDQAPLDPSAVMVKYVKGKLVVQPGDKELRSALTDNLSKLSEMPYQKLEEEDFGMDEGWRKAFALNLVVYYYSFGKNLTEVQRLFQKYYHFPDAKKVWSQFREILNYIKLNSTI